jgi:hypothetical protein
MSLVPAAPTAKPADPWAGPTRRRSPLTGNCRSGTYRSWRTASLASFTMGSRAEAWAGRESRLGRTVGRVPKSCARTCTRPAPAVGCNAIERPLALSSHAEPAPLAQARRS